MPIIIICYLLFVILFQVNIDGSTLRTIQSDRLVEPVCVAADSATRRLAVADNGARTVFVFDSRGNLELEVRVSFWEYTTNHQNHSRSGRRRRLSAYNASTQGEMSYVRVSKCLKCGNVLHRCQFSKQRIRYAISGDLEVLSIQKPICHVERSSPDSKDIRKL